MLWRDTATLIAITTTENNIGDSIESEVESEVFVNEKSVTRSEFYQAAQTDFRPETVLEIRTEDYSKQSMIDFSGIRYRIIRYYSKNQEITELVCEGLV